jgi:YhcH/YjgK/YiaL family protein
MRNAPEAHPSGGSGNGLNVMLAGLVSGLSSCALLYPAALRRALAAVADPALRTAPPGRYALEGDQMYYVLREFDTEPADRLFPETHREYCDVHFVISGKELVGWASKGPSFVEKEAYSKENDLQFYMKTTALNWLVAGPGQFILFSPDDVHLPGISVNGVETVRKAVVKIHCGLLS